MSQRHKVTLAIVGCWLVFFATQLLDTQGVPYERDLTQLYIPARFFLHAQLKSGHLPHWFPYELIGVPFLGQIVTATFHPQTLLFLPFSPVTAVKFNILLAYLFGVGGAYRLARATGTSRPAALLAATAFGYAGYGLSLHNNLPYLMGMMTLPWVGWRALRLADRERPGDIAGLAVAWALVFLAGDAQGTGFATVLVIAALVGRGCTRRSPILASGAGALMLLLISIELLPATSVFSGTFRMVTDAGDAPARVWAMHPLRLLEFVLPGFFPAGHEGAITSQLLGLGNGGLWARTVFVGVVPLSFFLLGLSRNRSALAFGTLALVSLWMATGAHGGLLPIVFRVVPLLGQFAYPEKYLALFGVACVPVVALGFDRARRVGGLSLLAFAVVGLSTLAAAKLLAPAGGTDWSDATRTAWTHGALMALGLAGAAAASLILARRYVAFSFLPVAVCFVELWQANPGIVTQADRRLFEQPTPIAQKVRESASVGQPVPRVAAMPAAGMVGVTMRTDADRWTRANLEGLKPDAASVWGIGTIGMALLPALPARMLTIASEEPSAWSQWLHTCWRTLPANATPAKADKKVLADDDFDIQLVTQQCFPYTFTAGALSVEDQKEALQRMQGLPPNMILWERGPVFPRARAHVELVRFDPGRVTLTTDSDARAALVISEGYSPGWHAAVDGTPAEVRPVNVVALGIEIPAGHHEVRFEYRTPRLKVGAALSLLGLLLAGVLIRAGRKDGSSRRPAKAAPAG